MAKITFGEKLRQLRTARSLTLAEVANSINITPSALGNYENGKREPNIETIRKLAQYFGVSFNYLFDTEYPEVADAVLNPSQNNTEPLEDRILKYVSENPAFLIRYNLPKLDNSDVDKVLRLIYELIDKHDKEDKSNEKH